MPHLLQLFYHLTPSQLLSDSTQAPTTVGVSINITKARGTWNNVFVHREALAEMCRQPNLAKARNFLLGDGGTLRHFLKSSSDPGLADAFVNCVTRRLRLDPVSGALCVRRPKAKVRARFTPMLSQRCVCRWMGV